MTALSYRFAKEFTEFPGGRARDDGDYSGEEFYEEVLLPLYQKRERVLLDLEGARGFATAFLDGAFGEFAARHGRAEFEKYFEVMASDDPTLPDEIAKCMDRAESDTPTS